MAGKKAKYILGINGCTPYLLDVASGDKDIYTGMDVESTCIVFTGRKKNTVDFDCIINQGDIDSIFETFCNCAQSDNGGGISDVSVLVSALEAICDKIEDQTEIKEEMLACLEIIKTTEQAEKPRYRIVGTCEYISRDDQKLDNPPITRTIIYEDCETEPPTLIEVEVGQPIENIFNPENYMKMGNFAGLPPQLPEAKTAEKTLEICGPNATGTIQDVLDAAIAAGTLLDGLAPDGIIALEIIGEYKGQQCAGQTLTSSGPTAYGAEGSVVSIDGGQKFCEALKYADEDCDGLADACYDLTTPLVIPEGAGVIVNVKLALCDDDPTTPASGEEGGEG